MTHKDRVHDEAQFQVLRLLQNNPKMTQRQLAGELRVSLGKTNYCLTALIDKGLLKVQNFRGNQNKLAYAYLLTPKGVAEKTVLTARFLKRKVQEYERLQVEIESLKHEISDGGAQGNRAS